VLELAIACVAKRYSGIAGARDRLVVEALMSERAASNESSRP
jgi:hypothetical protein